MSRRRRRRERPQTKRPTGGAVGLAGLGRLNEQKGITATAAEFPLPWLDTDPEGSFPVYRDGMGGFDIARRKANLLRGLAADLGGVKAGS